ncbi:sensor histidine kinase [Listeria sp. PSOL-1]|uniref:sensor histidine kinase n=1 Tax=Listeria sp. PSOL-1 TaxID=1844999 RepID=UPI0013D3FEB1|nr:GHKL domain-containing protein [Listeria sp. PSOL-1]
MEIYYIYFIYINGIIFSCFLGYKKFFFLKDILKYLLPFFAILFILLYSFREESLFTIMLILNVGVLVYHLLLSVIFWMHTKKVFIALILLSVYFMSNFIPHFVSYEMIVIFLTPSILVLCIIYYSLFLFLLAVMKFFEVNYKLINKLMSINYSYQMFNYLFIVSFITFVVYRIHYSYASQQQRLLSTWLVVLVFLHLFIIAYAIAKREIEYQLVQRQAEEYRIQREQIDQTEEFKHDYKGILLSLMSFLEQERNDEALTYLKKLANYSETELADDVYSEVSKITNFPIQGALLKKIQYIKERNIALDVRVLNYITHIEINIFDCIRILNIVLDNAMEASVYAERPSIEVELAEVDQHIYIRVANNLPSENKIDLQKITNKNYSTKAGHRGKGLHIIKKICNKYSNLHFNIQITDEKFIILLEIH